MKQTFKDCKCYYCEQPDHRLLDCLKFKEVSVDRRLSFAKSKRLCFKCLSSRHKTAQCKREKPCSVEGCRGNYHHTLLHNPLYKPKSATAHQETVLVSSAEEIDCVSVSASAVTSDTYLCIVPVRVRHRDCEVVTYAFLDQGSTHSFCDKKLTEALKLKGAQEKVLIKTLTSSEVCLSDKCTTTVLPLDSDEEFVL